MYVQCRNDVSHGRHVDDQYNVASAAIFSVISLPLEQMEKPEGLPDADEVRQRYGLSSCMSATTEPHHLHTPCYPKTHRETPRITKPVSSTVTSNMSSPTQHKMQQEMDWLQARFWDKDVPQATSSSPEPMEDFYRQAIDDYPWVRADKERHFQPSLDQTMDADDEEVEIACCHLIGYLERYDNVPHIPNHEYYKRLVWERFWFREWPAADAVGRPALSREAFDWFKDEVLARIEEVERLVMTNEDGDNMDAVALIHRVLEELGRGDVNAARTRGEAWSYAWKGKTWRGGQGGKVYVGGDGAERRA
jgi:hypothetical protein